jgi:rhamnulokinase
LIGIESETAIISEASLKYNVTNEGGVCNTIRFLKNIMGMWLLQESRRQWAKTGRNYSYDELTNLAAQAPAFQSLVFVGDHRFLAPGDMVDRIQAFCRETGQSIPQPHAQVVRCILESLALEYRWGTEKLRELSGKALPVIHIIGGGSRNRLLNQLTADATGCEVIAGPVEATAIGNILLQAIALGHLSSLAEGRALVRRSFDVTSYEPQIDPARDEAYGRYLALRKE